MAFAEDSGNSGSAANTVSLPPAGSSSALHPSSEGSHSRLSQTTEEAQDNPSTERRGNHPASSAWGTPVPCGASPLQGTQLDHMMPFLGMHINHGQCHGHSDRSYNYMKKYPADPEGKETAPEARLWKVYLDEAEVYDTDMVTGFRNTLDGTLVFATLFSSLVTSFIIEASQKLEPDYAQINASLLVENNLLLRAGGNVSKINAVKESPLGVDSVTHSWPDVLMNSAFFASLSLALTAALFSILVKHWLQTFTTVIRGDTKERCLIRQLRFTGLEKWRLSEIINALPIFLHVSLALFFMGLGIFVRDFHLAIRIVVNGIACATAAVYITTLILPAIYLDCPYRLPILHIPASFMVHLVKQVLQIARRRPLLLFQSSPFFSQERELALDFQLPLMASCVSWLFTESTNNSVRSVSVRGAVGLTQEHDLVNWFHRAEMASLPVTEMLSFVLRSGDSLRLVLAEQLPLVRSLVGSLRILNQTPPTELWDMALRTPALIDLLFEEGVNLDVTFSWHGLKAYPFQHACIWGLWRTAVKLLPYIPPSHLTAFGSRRWTPLLLVCGSRRISEERRLTLLNGILAKGARVGDVDKHGLNALHYTFKDKDLDHGIVPSLEFLRTLLSSANPFPAEVLNKHGVHYETPLIMASRNRSPSHIRALLEAGADANIPDAVATPPLSLACSRIASFAEPLDFEVFEMLVDATTNAALAGNITTSSGMRTGKTALDQLISHRYDTDEATFTKAYKLMRAKGAQCVWGKKRQAEIDAELGVTTVEEDRSRPD